jgi:hypothetical protein
MCAAGYRYLDAFSALAKAPSWQDWVPIYDKSALPGRVTIPSYSSTWSRDE